MNLQGLGSKVEDTQSSKDGLMQDATLFSVMADSPLMIDGCLWHLQLDVKAAQGSELNMEQQSQLQKVLKEFSENFTERLGLPPKRDLNIPYFFKMEQLLSVFGHNVTRTIKKKKKSDGKFRR